MQLRNLPPSHLFLESHLAHGNEGDDDDTTPHCMAAFWTSF